MDEINQWLKVGVCRVVAKGDIAAPARKEDTVGSVTGLLSPIETCWSKVKSILRKFGADTYSNMI